MAQAGININRPWLLGNSQFQFVPPWFKQYNIQQKNCYFCDAPLNQPLVYQENPPGYLCPNCFAPICNIGNNYQPHQSICPSKPVSHCKPANFFQPICENFKTGYTSSYPGLFYLSIISGTTTVFSTLCLLRQGGTGWITSLIAGSLSTIGTLSGYYKSRRFTPTQPRNDSLYNYLRILEKDPDILTPIIGDSFKRYQFYQLMKSLTYINQQTCDPIVRELQQNAELKNIKLAQTSLQQTLPILNKENNGIIRSCLDNISSSIPSDINITLKDQYTQQDIGVIFSALSLTKDSINLTITSQTEKAFDLTSIILPENTSALSFENINIEKLPDHIWCVHDHLTLKNVTGLDYLPELPTNTPNQPLTLTILNSSIKALPKTLINRKIQNLDLTGCTNINNLPATLCQPIKDNTIQTLNLTGTNVWSTYQRNIILNEEVREKLSTFDPKTPHELFCNQAIVCNTPRCTQEASCCAQPISLILLCVLGLMTPFALILMVFDHCFWRKKHDGITNNPLFWITYLTSGTALAIGLNYTQSTPTYNRKSLYTVNNKMTSGDTIFDVYNLINRQGRHCFYQDIYDWDYLWGQIFDQANPYFYHIPAPVTCFLESFVGALEGKFEGQLGQQLYRLYQCKGKSYFNALASMPFYRMVKTLEMDTYRFPVILNAVQDMRNCIGKPGKQYHTIELCLEQFIQTQMPVPDPDPQVMQSLFALIASGYHVDLSLDWLYNGRVQPLQFDTLPMTSNIDRLVIVNAYLNQIPQRIWWVKDEIHLHNISGLTDLPEIPETAPRLPLRLGLTQTSLSSLPYTLSHRPLVILDLSNSTELRSLPESIKTAITSNRIKRLSLTGTSFNGYQNIYEADNLKALAKEDIFDMPIYDTCPQLQTNYTSPPTFEENTYAQKSWAPYPQTPCPTNLCDTCVSQPKQNCTSEVEEKKFCCVNTFQEPSPLTIRIASTVGCIALGAFALWKLKPAIITNKTLKTKDADTDTTCQAGFIEPVDPLPTTQFDFFQHPDFCQHADMLLGYIVEDPWAYEALQKFITIIPTIDHGQNWSCHEYLSHILDRRLDFTVDGDCLQTSCAILPSSINIRYNKNDLCDYMVDALQGQTIKDLLKPEVVLHLNLFQEHIELTDGTPVNLREEIIVLLYALGYTAPGKTPEELFRLNGAVCFIQN